MHEGKWGKPKFSSPYTKMSLQGMLITYLWKSWGSSVGKEVK